MKLLKILPLLLVASLTACSDQVYFTGQFYSMDTFISMKHKNTRGYPGDKTMAEIKNAAEEVDAVADSYKKRDVVSVYDINQTNEKIEISKRLHNILSFTLNAQSKAKFFNPFVGSLSTKWKESLAKREVLSNEIVQEELAKINSSSLTLSSLGNAYYAERTGEATLDLGAIAKGYFLDRCQDLCDAYVPTKDYLINAGNSSVLLGTNSETPKGVDKGDYVIKLKGLSKPTYIHRHNCFISTSGIDEQNTVIDGVTYSHIINPVTGSAISLYDTVIVINNNSTYENGSFGDALSTSFMMTPLEEIKEYDQNSHIEVIVIKDDAVLYQSPSITLY